MIKQYFQMIKIIFMILIIVILVTSLHIYITKYMDKVHSEISSKTNDLIQLIKDKKFPEAEALSDDIHSKWEKHADVMPVFIDHLDIDLISLDVNELKAYIKAKDADSALAEAESVLTRLENTQRREELSISNIF